MEARHIIAWLVGTTLAWMATFAHAETFVYRYGGIDHPTLAQAESAMRGNNGIAGSDLYPCGATPGAPGVTPINYLP